MNVHGSQHREGSVRSMDRLRESGESRIWKLGFLDRVCTARLSLWAGNVLEELSELFLLSQFNKKIAEFNGGMVLGRLSVVDTDAGRALAHVVGWALAERAFIDCKCPLLDPSGYGAY